MDSNDEEYLPTTDLDNLVSSRKPVPKSWEYLCIHQIPRPATTSPQLDQVEMPPEPEQMDIEIPENLPDLFDVPEELFSDFDSWAHNVLEYWW